MAAPFTNVIPSCIGDFKGLEGDHLKKLQLSLQSIEYFLIIAEILMIGQKLFSQVDKKIVCQIFPHHSCDVLGGCSSPLFGDFDQLPPVMDLLLYTTCTSSPLSDIGANSFFFNSAVVLDQVMRHAIR